jgi:hypothetical protein
MRLLCLASAIIAASAGIIAQQPAGRRAGTATVLQLSYAGIKADLVAEAAAMPEADYSFTPGTMPEVRTFAQVILHVAEGQNAVCGSLKGVSAPARGPAVSSKADVVRALNESFAFCDDVFAAATDANLVEFVRQGPNELTRTSVLYGLLAHNAEMYGIGTVYLRLKGIVPPSTARQNAGRGRGQ